MSARAPELSRGLRRALGICVALLTCQLAQALPEDRSKPIHITADKALRDEKQGFTVYEGNVRMQQGSLQIAARRITVFHEVEEADRILAEGSPAHMQQQPEPEEAMMHARAETIEYFKQEERVLLSRNASIEQDGSRVTGDSIEYFIGKQLIRADSTNGDDAGANGRVEVVIPARAMNDSPAADSAEPNQPATGEVNDEDPRGAADSE